MSTEISPTDAWYRSMHQRMLGIARRRVDTDDAEDVVQQAMQIIVEKGVHPGGEVDGQPSLAWCLRVLRNVIGNHYQRSRVQRRHVDASMDLEQVEVAIESLDADAAHDRLTRLLAEFARDASDCGRYLRRLAEDADVHEIAAEENIASHAFYQRLYRCRRRFREFLRARGVLT